MPSFHPPENFDFTTPERWPAWRDRFFRYRLASGLHKDDGDVQVAALIYSMGPEAEHIVQTLKLSEEQSKNFDFVVTKLNDYFIPKRNFIAERHSFELRSQNAGESNESYIRALFALAEHCNFSDQEERIRDRLISGMYDRELSRKVQLKSLEEDVTVNTVISMMRNVEIVSGHHNSGSSDVSRIRASQPARQQHRQHVRQQPRQQRQQ